MAGGGQIGVKVEGINQVTRALIEMGVEVEDLKRAFHRIGTAAIPVYQSVTPVGETGRLRRDYRASKTRNKAMLRVGRASVPYAGPQQWGWPKYNIRPQHWVQAGDRRFAPRVLDMLAQEITNLANEKGFK